MHEVDRLTPTEQELLAVTGDFEKSLPTVTAAVMRKLRTPNLIVTTGRRGAVLFRPREESKFKWFRSRLRSEHTSCLTDRVDDPVGTGDALLATASLALCGGATLPQANFT